jgi:aspartyl-tRNA(Asn)/glutamyl-tRNA(Gln) amidotransferase subunit B
MQQWETVIGLEVHTQLTTQSKIFSGASIAFGAEPNTQACQVDIALPGVLPVLNKGAVERAIKFGLAIGAKLNRTNIFARKNYFYPDLPKGYQISQFELPIVEGGALTVQVEGDKPGDKTVEKTVRITRAHLEEDAGKSLHEDFHGMTGIDLNRAGTPLLEIVSEPDMRSAREAVAYAKALHTLVTWIGTCDGNMQEGSFRVDANVSVRPLGQKEFGTRREIKNLNSFRFLEQAINYEVRWQIEQIEDGHKIQQATVLFNPDTGETRAMRSKEDAHDYRYFPDPDLLPVKLDEAWIEQVKASLPELPEQKQARYRDQLGLSAYDANTLTGSRAMAEYFEAVLAGQANPDAKLAANWIMGDLSAALNKAELDIADSRIRRPARRPAGPHPGRHPVRQAGQAGVRGHVVRGRGGGRHHRGQGSEADVGFRRDRTHHRRGDGRQRQVGGGVPFRQGEGLQRPGGPGHEGQQGQGQSGPGQRTAEEKTRRGLIPTEIGSWQPPSAGGSGFQFPEAELVRLVALPDFLSGFFPLADEITELGQFGLGFVPHLRESPGRALAALALGSQLAIGIGQLFRRRVEAGTQALEIGFLLIQGAIPGQIDFRLAHIGGQQGAIPAALGLFRAPGLLPAELLRLHAAPLFRREPAAGVFLLHPALLVQFHIAQTGILVGNDIAVMHPALVIHPAIGGGLGGGLGPGRGADQDQQEGDESLHGLRPLRRHRSPGRPGWPPGWLASRACRKDGWRDRPD